MNQMQAMMMQMNKMKRDFKKASEELAAKEFVIAKSGLVKVTVLGNKTVSKIEIDEDAFEKENKEMVEELTVAAINEALEKIEQALGDINEKIYGNRQGINF